jgi:hypothetical protein
VTSSSCGMRRPSEAIKPNEPGDNISGTLPHGRGSVSRCKHRSAIPSRARKQVRDDPLGSYAQMKEAPWAAYSGVSCVLGSRPYTAIGLLSLQASLVWALFGIRHCDPRRRGARRGDSPLASAFRARTEEAIWT